MIELNFGSLRKWWINMVLSWLLRVLISCHLDDSVVGNKSQKTFWSRGLEKLSVNYFRRATVRNWSMGAMERFWVNSGRRRIRTKWHERDSEWYRFEKTPWLHENLDYNTACPIYRCDTLLQDSERTLAWTLRHGNWWQRWERRRVTLQFNMERVRW